MKGIIDTALDLIVDFIPWKPCGWDVKLTRRWGSRAVEHKVWSEKAKRWVVR